MQFGTSVPCLNCLRPFLACFCGGRYEVELVPVARKVEKRNWFRSPGKWESGTGSGCQGSIRKRNWFRLCRESRKAELVPVARKVGKRNWFRLCQESRKAELVLVVRKLRFTGVVCMNSNLKCKNYACHNRIPPELRSTGDSHIINAGKLLPWLPKVSTSVAYPSSFLEMYSLLWQYELPD